MTILLHALSLENYRGIGPDTQYMTGFQQLNFFIGTNNSGKSIILNYISKYIAKKAPEPIERMGVDSVERFRGMNGGTPNSKIGVPHELVSEKMIASITNWGLHGNRTQQLAKTLIETASLFGQIWLKYSLQNQRYVVEHLEADITNDENYNANWQNLTSAITPSVRGGHLPSRREHVIAQLKTYAEFKVPETNIIPAKRELGPTGEAFEGLSGKGLIDQLAEIQSPDHHERDKHLIFDKINQFVSNVIGKQDAKIEVPHDRKHLIVHIDDKVLPLSSLGTGIHEVILIAAFCTLKENQIVCIEEPEIHLHPTLQRKLIEYLRQNTSNQYFIATHSAALIDTEDASVFRVANDGYQTRVSKIDLKQDRRNLCAELGYRASDIVQANCVIWVEGPSDRIYLNKWIWSKRSDLREGTDYSIMFYGGRLLSHLSAMDEDENARSASDLIDLQSLNKNTVVMIDSDKATEGDEINFTKQRIQKELEDGEGLPWITQGREIENYVPYAELQKAVKEIHASVYLAELEDNPFGHALHFKQDKEKSKSKTPADIFTKVDKVAVAKLVCKNDVNWDVLDLEDRISGLISFIEKANK